MRGDYFLHFNTPEKSGKVALFEKIFIKDIEKTGTPGEYVNTVQVYNAFLCL